MRNIAIIESTMKNTNYVHTDGQAVRLRITVKRKTYRADRVPNVNT